MRILLVEDEVKALEGIARLIGELPGDDEVAGQAKSAKEGIELAHKCCPDLIITDIQMSGMSGLEMIRALSEEGFKGKYIILSGFADFRYAQEGISLGITNYLLKPVTVHQLRDAVEKVRQEIEQESRHIQIPQLGLGEVLEGALFADTSMRGRYQEEWTRRTQENTAGFMLLVRGDNRIVQSDWGKIREILLSLFQQIGLTGCVHARSKEYYIYFPVYKENYLRRLDDALMQCRKKVNCYLVFSGIRSLPGQGAASLREQLLDLSDWNLCLTGEMILTPERIGEMQTKKLVYPEEMERRLVGLIENGTADQMTEILDSFIDYLQDGQYAYTDVREALITMTASILYAIRRSSYGLYENISSMHVLDWVKEALFLETYRQLISNILEKYVQCRTNQHYSGNPIVNRAMKILSREYTQDLSLEEMAVRVDVTPEYLSTLFMKELGIKYTTCRAQVRIDKAKSLLAEGNLKIYEVAEQSGFPDVKYFTKVFKKFTGVSPGEYVRVNRS